MYSEVHGAGEPLLVIRGIGGEIPSLSADRVRAVGGAYRAITFDSRGSGRSDTPDEPCSIEQMAGDTVGLVDAIGPPADILGISTGSRIAPAVAARSPERVRSLIPTLPNPHRSETRRCGSCGRPASPARSGRRQNDAGFHACLC